MKGGNCSPQVILVSAAISSLILYLLLRDSSSGEAKLCFRSLAPFFPYSRRVTIEEKSLTALTLEQHADSSLQLRDKMNHFINIGADQGNKELIETIRNNLIKRPSLQGYKLRNTKSFDYSGGQSAIVDNNLRFKEDGFYVECCKTDGEIDSTSLFFEKYRKWNGLVITTDEEKYQNLSEKNRKAFTMNGCLSTSDIIERTSFSDNAQKPMYCLPLLSIMLALKQTSIDLLALDVGGEGELSILKSIPLQDLDIDMISVRFRGEIRHFKSEVQLYLEDAGYDTILKLIKEEDDSTHHLILKKNQPSWIFTFIPLVLSVLILLMFGCIVYTCLPKLYPREQLTFIS